MSETGSTQKPKKRASLADPKRKNSMISKSGRANSYADLADEQAEVIDPAQFDDDARTEADTFVGAAERELEVGRSVGRPSALLAARVVPRALPRLRHRPPPSLVKFSCEPRNSACVCACGWLVSCDNARNAIV